MNKTEVTDLDENITNVTANVMCTYVAANIPR